MPFGIACTEVGRYASLNHSKGGNLSRDSLNSFLAIFRETNGKEYCDVVDCT